MIFMRPCIKRKSVVRLPLRTKILPSKLALLSSICETIQCVENFSCKSRSYP